MNCGFSAADAALIHHLLNGFVALGILSAVGFGFYGTYRLIKWVVM